MPQTLFRQCKQLAEVWRQPAETRPAPFVVQRSKAYLYDNRPTGERALGLEQQEPLGLHKVLAQLDCRVLLVK